MLPTGGPCLGAEAGDHARGRPLTGPPNSHAPRSGVSGGGSGRGFCTWQTGGTWASHARRFQERQPWCGNFAWTCIPHRFQEPITGPQSDPALPHRQITDPVTLRGSPYRPPPSVASPGRHANQPQSTMMVTWPTSMRLCSSSVPSTVKQAPWPASGPGRYAPLQHCPPAWLQGHGGVCPLPNGGTHSSYHDLLHSSPPLSFPRLIRVLELCSIRKWSLTWTHRPGGPKSYTLCCRPED